METAHFEQSSERVVTSEEKERLNRALFHYGIVDATLCDQPATEEHPTDRRWAVEIDYNPNIILSID